MRCLAAWLQFWIRWRAIADLPIILATQGVWGLSIITLACLCASCMVCSCSAERRYAKAAAAREVHSGRGGHSVLPTHEGEAGSRRDLPCGSFLSVPLSPPPPPAPPPPPPPPHTHTHSSSACLLPLQVGHSNGVVLVLPGGLAMRVSQPVAPLATSAAKGKQHRRFQPWLDLYVQLQGRPAAPLGGLLGTTLPQVLGASASPAGLAAALLNTF